MVRFKTVRGYVGTYIPLSQVQDHQLLQPSESETARRTIQWNRRITAAIECAVMNLLSILSMYHYSRLPGPPETDMSTLAKRSGLLEEGRAVMTLYQILGLL